VPSNHQADETTGDVLDRAVHVPEHVIFRSFARETVALNLDTGTFHGLNPTAGRMVEVASRARCARDAVSPLAREYGVPDERIAGDLGELLRLLIERGLIEIDE
jgi:Coenzyme PQQ synthesis protein D (PqqD)